jgi:hypothetical protein
MRKWIRLYGYRPVVQGNVITLKVRERLLDSCARRTQISCGWSTSDPIAETTNKLLFSDHLGTI